MISTTRGEMRAEQVGELFIIVALRTCDEAAWAEWVELAAEKAKANTAVAVLNLLSEGVAPPSAAQRKLLSERVNPKAIRYNAVLTESALVRGALTAMNWMLRDVTMRSFRTSEYMAALEWCNKCGAKFDPREAAAAIQRLRSV